MSRNGLQIVGNGGIGQELADGALALLDPRDKAIEAGDEGIQLPAALVQMDAQSGPGLTAGVPFRADRDPRVDRHAEFLQNRQDRTADFVNRGFHRHRQFFADDGGILPG